MSDVISGWVDSDEMRRLAETLLARPTAQDIKRLEIDFGSKFEGYASEYRPQEAATPSPAASEAVTPSTAPPLSTKSLSSESTPPEKGRQQVADEEPAKKATPPSMPPYLLKALEKKVVEKSEPESQAPEAALGKELKTSPEGLLPKKAVESPSPPPVEPPLSTGEPEPPAAQGSTPPPVPGMMKSAVNFLKKAQVEGMAGGIIKSGAPPEEAEEPAVSAAGSKAKRKPSSEGKGPIFSPFRRVSDAVRPTPPVSPPNPVQRKLVRPPAPSGDDPILARVRHFGEWLKGPVAARHFFISNMEGKILIDEVENPKLIEVARTLAGASKAGGEESSSVASLHVRIGDDAILEVIPTPSQFGTLILGLIVRQPLPEDYIREVRAGLQEVADARLIRAQSRRT